MLDIKTASRRYAEYNSSACVGCGECGSDALEVSNPGSISVPYLLLGLPYQLLSSVSAQHHYQHGFGLCDNLTN